MVEQEAMHADSTELRRIQIIDSHTGGEPTRVVIAGGPGLLGGSVSERRTRFSEQFDQYRTALCGEPRGSDVLVGALLVEPEDKRCVCGVIFFNNVGCLGMCGHGIIGVVTTLAYLGKLQPGVHRIETPVGVVWATLHDDGRVSVRNVASYRSERAVALTLPSGQRVTGDIAWGGNWFFLCADHGEAITAGNVARLTALSGEIRRTLNQTHPEIDHIELFGPPGDPANHSRSFVLCPGGAYDRSPCGTGTSAKLACLAADGKLAPGEVWRQESVIGSVFEGCIELAENGVIPTITGRAWISAETTLLLDESDPFCWGIPSP